jgi:hypothetical protein
MARPTIRTQKRRATILEEFTKGASVRAVLDVVGIARSAYYEWIESDPQFAAEVAAAKEAGTEFLEDVARKRAVESSDTLLIFLLKARKPEMYRDTQRLEHTGVDGTPLTVVITERPDGPQ